MCRHCLGPRGWVHACTHDSTLNCKETRTLATMSIPEAFRGARVRPLNWRAPSLSVPAPTIPPICPSRSVPLNSADLPAQVELAGLASPWQRVTRAAEMSRVFAGVLVDTLLMAPYGLRALRLHRGLPEHGAASSDGRQLRQQRGGVSIVRDVRYGPGERCTLDVYLPAADVAAADAAGAETAANGGGAGAGGAAAGSPVCFFCHGGVWATGEKWHYSPMGARLAQAGVLAVVPQYTLYVPGFFLMTCFLGLSRGGVGACNATADRKSTGKSKHNARAHAYAHTRNGALVFFLRYDSYPQALVPQQVAELSLALSWAMDNVGRLGGDPSKVRCLFWLPMPCAWGKRPAS